MTDQPTDSDAPRQLLARAETLAGLERNEEARTLYRQVIEQAPDGSAEQLEAYHGLLPTYDAERQPCDAQVQACIAAIERFPHDTHLLLAMGSYMQQRDELELAERSFEAAFRQGRDRTDDINTKHHQLDGKVPPADAAALPLAKDEANGPHGSGAPSEPGPVGDVAGVCLAIVRQLLGQHEPARQTLLEAAERYPDSTRVRRHLLDAHIKAGDEAAALGLIEGLDADPTIADVVRGACRASQGKSAAGLGLLQSAYVAGCRNPLCLRWLVAVLLREGQLDAARPLMDEWEKLDPDSPELRAYRAAIQQFDADVQSDQQFRVDAAQPGSPHPESGQHAARSPGERIRRS